MRIAPATIFSLCCVPFSHGSAGGDSFVDGLGEWNVLNDVSVVAESVRFADSDVFATLWKSFEVNPGLPVEIHFDFLAVSLADAVSGGGSPDSFFASLYFTDGTGPFDPMAPAFELSYDLVNLFPGQVVPNSGAIVGPALQGGSWQTFTWGVAAVESQAVIVFDLLDTNGEADDSLMFIDNVGLVPVPEISSGGLLSLIFAAGLSLQRWRVFIGTGRGVQV